MTPFDCKDENSFGFSVFVDVRFKLCSVVLIWIKHSLLFRNTVEPPLTVTSPQWPPTATSLQRPFFFLGGQSMHLILFQPPYNGHLFTTVSLFCYQQQSNLYKRSPLYNGHLSWRTVHTLNLVSTSLQWLLSSFPKVERFNCT